MRKTEEKKNAHRLFSDHGLVRSEYGLLARDWSLNKCSCTMMTVYMSCSMFWVNDVYFLLSVNGYCVIFQVDFNARKIDNEFSYDLKVSTHEKKMNFEDKKLHLFPSLF